MRVYITKPRKIILNFLSNHIHEIFSVSQIVEYCKLNNVSSSAVYRNLTELEGLGQVKRVSVVQAREAYYQYVNASACANRIHLQCDKCHKIEHLSISDEMAITNMLVAGEKFTINNQNTVIHGICKNCSQE